MSSDTVVREIVVNAPIERVWDVLTSPQHVAEWFGDTAEIDLRPGGAMTFGWKEQGDFKARVEIVEPPTRFAYRWNFQNDEPVRDDTSTLVDFTLTADGDATKLRVVESGFTGLALPAEEQERHRRENTEGWISELAELAAYAEGRSAATT